MNVQYKGPLVTMGEVEDKNATASKMRSYRASGCADLLPGTAVLLAYIIHSIFYKKFSFAILHKLAGFH